MQIIDTHSHIYGEQFNEDQKAMLQRAQQSGVSKILLPNIDLESYPAMLQLQQLNPDLCFAMCGLHPCDVKEDYQDVLAFFEKELHADASRFIAIGETGIDLYWDKTTLAIQIESLTKHIEWAKQYNLPLVIHARDSYQEIFEVLKIHHDSSLRGVFHCFTAGQKEADFILGLETFMFGIGGVITYKNNQALRDVVATIPTRKLLLETDAPYLPPVPYRGKRNEPSYLPYVLDVLATTIGKSRAETAALTTENAKEMFRL
ncbi:MAG: TatD family hydrolase [Luteibaculaceae bacterium]